VGYKGTQWYEITTEGHWPAQTTLVVCNLLSQYIDIHISIHSDEVMGDQFNLSIVQPKHKINKNKPET